MHFQTFVLFTPAEWANGAADETSRALSARLGRYRYIIIDDQEPRPHPCRCVGARSQRLAVEAMLARPDQPLAGFWVRHGLNAPDRACQQCGGGGFYQSGLNLNGRLDYWRMLDLDEPDDEASAWLPAGDDPRGVFGGSARLVSELLRQLEAGEPVIPYAIETPDHQWFEDYDLHEPDASPPWPERARAVLERHADAVAVVIDAHR